MKRSQVPRGATKKEPCAKCGVLFHRKLKGSSMQRIKECAICDPEGYKEKKKR